jgi:hypothetical protein
MMCSTNSRWRDFLALGRPDAQGLQEQVAFDLAGCAPT